MEEKTGEEAIIEKRKKKLFSFLKSEYILVGASLLVLIILAWHIRTINVPGLKDVTTNNYTLGPDLDPFLFLRYMKYIVENGSLMEHDSMRYVPLEFDTAGETITLPYMMAYFHKFLSLFSDVSIEYSAVMFPVLMFLLAVVAFFLFIREVFDKHRTLIAFVASAFLIVIPILLSRTVAGIPEKEPAGFFFMCLSFYLFTAAWKADKLKKNLIFASLAGISTGVMGLIWGGIIYVFISITLAVLIEFILGKTNTKKMLVFGLWLFSGMLMLLLFSPKYTLISIASSTSTGFGMFVFVLLLADFLIFNTRIKNIKLIENLRNKLPDKAVSIFLSALIALVLSSFVLGISFIPDFISHIFQDLIHPYTDRLSFTVAENRQPYFNEWVSSFGPVAMKIPLIFWLFFFGSILLFYDTFNIEKKDRILLTLVYAIFLFGLIFSRYSPASIMNGTNNLSKIAYFGGFAMIVLVSCYLYYMYFKNNKLGEFTKIKSLYIFLFIFFLISLVGTRSAVRLIMVLAFPVAGIIGYLIVNAFARAREEKDEKSKFIFYLIALIIILAALYSFYFYYKISLASANSMVPSVYTQQWQKAMQWVRDNTPENAVFSHWWDYGYWIQTIGQRATILDGGNAIGYWNHLFGRHVLTGASENEALEFLYAHNASYLLIDSTDIGKYSAYSSIGSDENYDRFSGISTFFINERATEERKNETLLVYQGGVALDENFILKQESGELFFPAQASGVGALILPKADNKFNQPEAIFVYEGKQYRIALRYLYYENKLYDFKTGYGGALYVLPMYVPEKGINSIGAALFLSERNMRALWVRMYLLGEGNNFELAHSQDDYVIETLKNQGAGLKDFIYFNGIRGPIKIWKINYPSDIKFREEYLETIGPDSVMLARQA